MLPVGDPFLQFFNEKAEKFFVYKSRFQNIGDSSKGEGRTGLRLDVNIA